MADSGPLRGMLEINNGSVPRLTIPSMTQTGIALFKNFTAYINKTTDHINNLYIGYARKSGVVQVFFVGSA